MLIKLLTKQSPGSPTRRAWLLVTGKFSLCKRSRSTSLESFERSVLERDAYVAG